jgi:hypothetical protein
MIADARCLQGLRKRKGWTPSGASRGHPVWLPQGAKKRGPGVDE